MNLRKFVQRALLFVPLLFAGCAAAYHDYPGGCVPCHYCPLRPLPYRTYCRSCCTSGACGTSLPAEPQTSDHSAYYPEGTH